MRSSVEIQNAYVDLYKQIRKYIWAFSTVEVLAELEVAIYSSFPDIQEIRNKFNQLYQDIREQCMEDEDLNKSVEDLRELIESDGIFYAKIEKVREVVKQ